MRLVAAEDRRRDGGALPGGARPVLDSDPSGPASAGRSRPRRRTRRRRAAPSGHTRRSECRRAPRGRRPARPARRRFRARPRRTRARGRPRAGRRGHGRPGRAGTGEAGAEPELDSLARGSGRRSAGRPPGRARARAAPSAASTTATSTPSADAEVATSPPMNPAPTTASRRPGRSSRRSAIASASVRRTWTPAGRSSSVRARAPVASTRRRQASMHPPSVTAMRVRASIRGDARAEQELDAVLPPVAVGPQGERLGRLRPDEQLLRERRPLVGRAGLLAHERDASLVAARAQRLGAARAGEAGSDDEHVVVHHAAFSSITVIAPIGHAAAASSTRGSVLVATATAIPFSRRNRPPPRRRRRRSPSRVNGRSRFGRGSCCCPPWCR